MRKPIMNCVIDFENFFSSEISITTMGTWAYTRNEKTRPYIVSIKSATQEYVGSVDDFDWASISGPNFQQWAFNASYDAAVYMRLHEEDPVAFPLPVNPMMCASDLAVFSGLPQSLAGAVSAAFGEVMSKEVRSNMKGKLPSDLDDAGREALRKYALDDSIWALKLVEKYAPAWPECERKASLLTRQMGWEGVLIDQELLAEGKKKLQQQIWEARNQIPWAGEAAALSPKQLGLKCREVGIEPPTSLAITSEECEAWEDKHGDTYPWVGAMRTVRRANAILKKLETMEARIKPDGRMDYNLKYWGAGVTGRWSGAGGWNCQNIPSKPMFGVDMRAMIIAPPGKKLIVSDLSQIEPRVLCLLTREKDQLRQMADGTSPYITYARQAMGLGPAETWEKNNPKYKVAKIAVLSASYLTGHHKLLAMMKLQGLTDLLDGGPESPQTKKDYLNLLDRLGNRDWNAAWEKADDLEKGRILRCFEIIMQFRNGRPKWKELVDTFKAALNHAASRKEDLEIDLPSGRTLKYLNPRFRTEPLPSIQESIKKGSAGAKAGSSSVWATIMRHGRAQETRLHPGPLVENCCQGTARDAFRDCLIRVADAGYKIILQVHDELVVEVDEATAEEDKVKIEQLMGISPDWAPSLPVAAEAQIVDHYCK